MPYIQIGRKKCKGIVIKNNAQSIRSKNPFALPTLCIFRNYLSLFLSEWDNNLFSGSRPTLPMSYGMNTRRKPLLLLRLAGLLLLRLAQRQFCALLFQLPPRNTRFEPSIDALFKLNIFNYFFSKFFSVSMFCKSY